MAQSQAYMERYFVGQSGIAIERKGNVTLDDASRYGYVPGNRGGRGAL